MSSDRGISYLKLQKYICRIPDYTLQNIIIISSSWNRDQGAEIGHGHSGFIVRDWAGGGKADLRGKKLWFWLCLFRHAWTKQEVKAVEFPSQCHGSQIKQSLKIYADSDYSFFRLEARLKELKEPVPVKTVKIESDTGVDDDEESEEMESDEEPEEMESDEESEPMESDEVEEGMEVSGLEAEMELRIRIISRELLQRRPGDTGPNLSPSPRTSGTPYVIQSKFNS